MTNDLISRSALKKTFENACIYGLPMNELYGAILKIIDNAPTVEAYPFEQVQELVKLNQQFAQEIENLKRTQVEPNWRFYYDHGYAQAKRDFERPQGEWIWLGDNPNPNHKWSCSKCGRGVKEQENFCPNCGADMRGDDK